MKANQQKPNCKTCGVREVCQDSAVSWFFLFVGLLATLAIRVVNLVLEISPFWAKFSWYTGVAGFFIYFLYKFRQDRQTQQELLRLKMADKLTQRKTLSPDDYEFLMGAVCRLKSAKDTLNYFFIFLTSGLALILAVYQDFIRR